MSRPEGRPLGNRLDAWGMPPCDSTHPDCCKHTDRFRARPDEAKAVRNSPQESTK